jgi:flavodoxin
MLERKDIMGYKDKKCLIAYFSHAGENYVSGKTVELRIGNTEKAAQMIKLYTGGDMFRINTVEPYPYIYMDTVVKAKEEKKNGARPLLKTTLENFGEYAIVFLGYPNWCSTMPMAVWTFLESYDFSGKLILPFCTHEGSGFGHSLQDIVYLCPTAIMGKGLTIFGTTIADAEDDVKRWLNNC